MTHTLKSGKNTFVFKGFRNFTGKAPFMLIVMFDGEPDLYDWDGSEAGVAELKRYYEKVHEYKAIPLRYNEVI